MTPRLVLLTVLVTTGGNACCRDCDTNTTCGDGNVQWREECDDGNDLERDYCTTDCSWAVRPPRTLSSTTPSSGALFGAAVSATDEATAVGAPGIAAVEIFADGSPTPSIVLTSPGFGNDGFGASVELSSTSLVVGAPGQGEDTGVVYVFERVAPNGDFELKKLLAPPNQSIRRFGAEVSLHGSTLIIGGWDLAGDSGYHAVFERDEGGVSNWGHSTTLVAPNLDPSAKLGLTMSLDGNVAAVVAHTSIDDSDVFFFERDAGGESNWGFTAKVGIGGPSHALSIMLRDHVLVVGTPAVGSGRVSLFSRQSALDWVELADLEPATSVWSFGESTALLGDIAVAGARDEFEHGVVETLQFFGLGPGGTWSQTSQAWLSDKPDAPNLTMANGVLVAGMPTHDSQRGTAVVFTIR